MHHNLKWIIFLWCLTLKISCRPCRSWPVNIFTQTCLLKYWYFCHKLKTLMGFQNLASFLFQVFILSESFWLSHFKVSRKILLFLIFVFSNFHDFFQKVFLPWNFFRYFFALILPFGLTMRVFSRQHQSWFFSHLSFMVTIPNWSSLLKYF